MNELCIYVAAMNAASFAATALVVRYRQTATLACAFAAAGGAAGTLLALAVFDRHINKRNVAAWFASLLGIAVWAMAVAVATGRSSLDLQAILATDWRVLAPLGIYAAGMNLLAFATFLADKRLATKGRRRVPEAVLLLLAFLGGTIGGMLAMRLGRHKTKVRYFSAGLPAMLLVQVAALLFWLAGGWNTHVFG
jgi:uncharacterized membrane protein YsdA (DUF1294 family)